MVLDINKSIRGFMEIYLINTGEKFGIFSFLHKAKLSSLQQLSQKTKMPVKYMKMWCDVAYSFGLLNKEGVKYSLKKNLEPILGDKKSTQYLGDYIRLMASYLGPDMEKQYEYIRGNKKLSFGQHDKEFIELVTQRGERRGNIYLQNIIPQINQLEKGLERGVSLLDFGCGGGSFITTLAKEFKKSKFIGVEIDKTSVDLAKKLAKKEKLTDRTKFICQSGDEINYLNEFDFVTMNLVLHEINPQLRKIIVKSIYRALRPGGQIIVLEFPYPEADQEFSDPRFAMGLYDQFYEIIWGTEHITGSEQKKLLQSCKFKNVKRKFVEGGYVLITADKK
ncbi:class I SAM-dependent methyltransferase [Patescibacteria group bacterium]|nr:class I SAM-dependent methyltransferase [Patescibacteria group bacterium]